MLLMAVTELVASIGAPAPAKAQGVLRYDVEVHPRNGLLQWYL